MTGKDISPTYCWNTYTRVKRQISFQLESPLKFVKISDHFISATITTKKLVMKNDKTNDANESTSDL